MKKFIAACTIAGALVSQAAVITTNVAKDTYTRQGKPTMDIGGQNLVTFYQSSARMLMEVDLSGVTQQIGGVTLTVRMNDGANDENFTLSAYAMAYTANNYSWVEGTGMAESTVDTGSACHSYSSGTTPWEDSFGVGVGGITNAALWVDSLASMNVTWTNGEYLTITLDADVFEFYRDNYGKIVIGMWSADAAAGNFSFNSRSAGNADRRPVITIETIPEPASIGLLAISAAVLMFRRRFMR